MAFDLFLEPATIEVPVKLAGGFLWSNVDDDAVRDALAEEEQYLRFHCQLLDNLKVTAAGKVKERPWKRPLGLTIRAGAIRATVLLYTSIAEAALCYHARARRYPLPENQRRWQLGNILKAWEKAQGAPPKDVAPVWDEIKSLQAVRNHLHLFNKAHDEESRFDKIVEREADLRRAGDRILDHLREMESRAP